MTAPTPLGFLIDADDPSWGTDFTPTFNTFSAGQLLIIVGTWEDGAGLDSVSNGTGWTQFALAGTTPALFVYWKIATGSADTIPTFNSASFQRFSWATWHYAAGDFDIAVPLDVWTTDSGSSDNPPAPTNTPSGTRDHDLIRVAASDGDGAASTWTTPASHTLLGGHSIDYIGLGVAHRSWTTSGATGAATFGFPPANSWRTGSFFVRPTAAGSPQAIALVPIEIAVTPVALGVTPGPASIALVPITIAVTPVALIPSIAGTPQSIALVPIVISLVPGDVRIVAPELGTDIVTNEIWVREVEHPDVTWRAALVGPQGTGTLLELRSGVAYEVRALAIRANGSTRWSEWVGFIT